MRLNTWKEASLLAPIDNKVDPAINGCWLSVTPGSQFHPPWENETAHRLLLPRTFGLPTSSPLLVSSFFSFLPLVTTIKSMKIDGYHEDIKINDLDSLLTQALSTLTILEDECFEPSLSRARRMMEILYEYNLIVVIQEEDSYSDRDFDSPSDNENGAEEDCCYCNQRIVNKLVRKYTGYVC